MVDPVTVISSATAAVSLFDKIADQVERFITKSPTPAVPPQHRMTIEASGGDIIATNHGLETQRITAADLDKLPPNLLNHVQVYERSMENHYSVWSKVYPQLALMDGVQKAKVETQLGDEIRSMKADLDGILMFLESAGIYLDDHYLHIRGLVAGY